MSIKNDSEKSIIKQIQDILQCDKCNSSFDLSTHEPVILNTGETICKQCLIKQHYKLPIICNKILELIIKEISNFLEILPNQNLNIIYIKPGIKNKATDSTNKKISELKKRSLKNFFSLDNKPNEESITTISFHEDIGLTQNTSFEDEYKNFFKKDTFKKENTIKDDKNYKTIEKNDHYYEKENRNKNYDTCENKETHDFIGESTIKSSKANNKFITLGQKSFYNKYYFFNNSAKETKKMNSSKNLNITDRNKFFYNLSNFNLKNYQTIHASDNLFSKKRSNCKIKKKIIKIPKNIVIDKK